MKTILEGVDVQRGHGVVRADDGRRAELATVAVDAWHIKEHSEEELPRESLGQLHEGDTYIIRWTYSITTLGESTVEWRRGSLTVKQHQWRCYILGFCNVLTSYTRSNVVLFCSCQWGSGRNPASWAPVLLEERGLLVFSGKAVTPALVRKEPRLWWQWSWAATGAHKWVSVHHSHTQSIKSCHFYLWRSRLEHHLIEACLLSVSDWLSRCWWVREKSLHASSSSSREVWSSTRAVEKTVPTTQVSKTCTVMLLIYVEALVQILYQLTKR